MTSVHTPLFRFCSFFFAGVLAVLVALVPLASSAWASDHRALPVPDRTWFYPGSGDERATLQRDGERFLVEGTLPVRVSDGVVVRLVDEQAVELLESHPEVARIEHLAGPYPTFRVTVTTGADPVALSRNLHEEFGVLWSHPDFVLRLEPLGGGLDDTFWGTLWHLDNSGHYPDSVPDADIDGPEAWQHTRGTGMVVAILDTGVDPDHEDLLVVPGYDFVDGDEDPRPEPGTASYEHGTAMAGIAAARGNNAQGVAGVAWEASILPIRLIGGDLTTSALRGSFLYAADEGADVLSNSWSFSGGSCPEVPLYGALQEGIDHAVTEGRDGLGAAVVFGSGNGGCDVAQDGLASYEPVVLVGSSSDRDEVFDYSNFGLSLDLVAPSGPAPDGEGEYVRSTDIMGPDGYPSSMGTDNYSDTLWGTSASTPMVAATLALMFSANPTLSQEEARELLCATADRVQAATAEYDESGWSVRYGCGRVNAAAAVEASLALIEGDDDDSGSGLPAGDDSESAAAQGCACGSSVGGLRRDGRGASSTSRVAPSAVTLLLLGFLLRRRF